MLPILTANGFHLYNISWSRSLCTFHIHCRLFRNLILKNLLVEEDLCLMQSEIKSFSTIVFLSRLALDFLLAEQGRVCALLNEPGCVYLNETKQINIHKIKCMRPLNLFIYP